MNAMGPRKIYTEDELAELLRKARDVTKLYSSQAKAAVDAGIAESTFSAFLNGTYAGKKEAVAAKVDMWLATREEKAKISTAAMADIPFQRTSPADAILSMCMFAAVARTFNAVVDRPGIGKTRALQHFADNTPRTWLVTMSPSTSGVVTMLKAICRTMRLTEKSTTDLSWAIGTALKDGGTLLIDEAQFLTLPAVEELRIIRDLYKCGVVVAGNERLAALIKGDAKTSTAQVRSRLGMRYLNQLGNTDQDLGMVFEAWGIEADDQRSYLRGLARKPGALRNIAMTIQLGKLVATGQEQDLALEHLQLAWSQLSGADYGDRG